MLTPRIDTARRMGLLWGVHAVRTKDIGSFEEMIAKGRRMALRTGVRAGGKIIMVAGVPFGTPGSTNVLHVATLKGDELKGREERRSEEHTSELQSLIRNSNAVFCWKKKTLRAST